MTSELPKTANAVVVGGGTVGAWCAYFLRRAGLANVVLVEKGVLGQGASSRAAGVVRVQGGTPEAVRLGRWSRSFYLGQRAELGTDSGFVQQGYLLPCFTPAEVDAAQARISMQQSLGLPVRWLTSGEVDAINPTRRPGARSARPTATRTGTSPRPGTSPRTRPRWWRAASSSPSGRGSADCPGGPAAPPEPC